MTRALFRGPLKDADGTRDYVELRVEVVQELDDGGVCLRLIESYVHSSGEVLDDAFFWWDRRERLSEIDRTWRPGA
jgi:hypothetical protein